MKTENLSTLKINKLTQEQYERALEEGRINENEIYLTPDNVPLASGTGKNSIIANDIEEDSENKNTAISSNSSAFGVQSYAGSKGFKIGNLYTDVNANTATYNIFHVDDNDNDIINKQLAKLQEIINAANAEGRETPLVSIVYNNNYDLCAHIISVDIRIHPQYSQITIDNIPRVAGEIDTLVGDLDPLSSKDTIRFPEYPQYGTVDVGSGAFTEGKDNQAIAEYAHAEGYGSKAIGKASHAEGRSTLAVWGSHSEGQYTQALGLSSHAEGRGSEAIGDSAHAEGIYTKTMGSAAHAEGSSTIASASYAHAEGYQTKASNEASHAEGYKTWADSRGAHAEGTDNGFTMTNIVRDGAIVQIKDANGKDIPLVVYGPTAWNRGCHAEGICTFSASNGSHAEGVQTQAVGYASHAGGVGTRAEKEGQTAIGRYNSPDPNAKLIVGYGTGMEDEKRFNCFTTGKNNAGQAYITVGTTTLTETQLIKILNFIDSIEY